MKKDILLICRGLKEFEKILPGQMRKVFVRGILIAILPFVTTAVSAYLINQLLMSENGNHMGLLCFAGLAVIFCLTAWRDFEDSRIAVGFQSLFARHELRLTDKAYRLLYEETEKSSTHKLRDEVTGSINISGAGMASLYWDMDVLFTGVFSVLAASGIAGVYFVQLFVWDGNVNQTYGNVLGLMGAFLIFVVVCSYVTCKTSGKRFEVGLDVFMNGSRYNRYGDFYTLEYLADEDAAMDARIYGQEAFILSECQEKCYEYFAAGKTKEMNGVMLYDGIRLLCMCLCGIAVYVLIGQKAMQGALGAGSVLMMYTVVTKIIDSLASIAQIVTDLRNNNEHLRRYFQYMDLPEAEESREKEEAKQRVDTLAQIQFCNVCFRYPESDADILKDINLTICAGDRIALVGENGSGKTTLVKLLCRFYRPTEGVILLNGRDIWEYSQKEYVACIATVFQDFALFAFSLAENVAAAQQYEAGWVCQALEQAGFANRLKRMERGILQSLYHSFEEDGVDLSGGEEQKVAIARAIYKDSEFMVLDEPTAALDPYAEYEIYKNFDKITQKKTLLSISHRLSSCRMCDKVIVLENGEIVQRGSHDALVRQTEGKYYALWTAQAQYYNQDA